MQIEMHVPSLYGDLLFVLNGDYVIGDHPHPYPSP